MLYYLLDISILNIYFYISILHIFCIFKMLKMPAYERQGGEPGLSEEMDFDSRSVGTISKWRLLTTVDPTQYHSWPSVATLLLTAHNDCHKVSPVSSSSYPPIHFISLKAETKGHWFCSILLKHLYFQTFFLSISMNRFPGFSPRPVPASVLGSSLSTFSRSLLIWWI